METAAVTGMCTTTAPISASRPAAGAGGGGGETCYGGQPGPCASPAEKDAVVAAIAQAFSDIDAYQRDFDNNYAAYQSYCSQYPWDCNGLDDDSATVDPRPLGLRQRQRGLLGMGRRRSVGARCGDDGVHRRRRRGAARRRHGGTLGNGGHEHRRRSRRGRSCCRGRRRNLHRVQDAPVRRRRTCPAQRRKRGVLALRIGCNRPGRHGSVRPGPRKRRLKDP